MAGFNELKIEFNPDDGSLKVTSDQVSDANHASADRFLAILKELLGGEVVTTKRPEAHKHAHAHTHTTVKR